LSKALLQLLFEQQIERELHDNGRVTSRHLVPKQMLQLRQLVMQ
jgi:hypothetical protein